MIGRVLVTGGAGYVGSVVVEELLAAGAERVVVLDDLRKGHPAAVVPPAELVVGDIADGDLVGDLLRRERIDAVVHMAASSLVGESVRHPEAYYRNNVTGSLALAEAMLEAGVRRLVFSSTAAVYGEPATSPVTEDLPLAPTSPYGETKLAFERALGWLDRAHGLTSISLRYFNAAGASALNGEAHDPETHLIPVVLEAAAGRGGPVPVFGTDYPTPDGTCLRDYIHVADLARAHILALESLDRVGTAAYNLGCGGGYSVREVIDTVRRVTGRPVEIRAAGRRPGDPAVLVASSARAAAALGWRPARAALADIVADAWAWLERHPAKYAAM